MLKNGPMDYQEKCGILQALSTAWQGFETFY